MEPQECEDVAEQAWAATKDADDPEWGEAAQNHRERLIYLAQSVKRSKLADSPFELAVAKLLKPPKAAAASAGKDDEFGGLKVHSDESETPKTTKKKAVTKEKK